jgi:predicted metal-dependent hydrolase
LDAHYLGFFDCFNRQLYFEAHEVLEALWLKRRDSADGAFYKALIQLAGAFVHLQKGRPEPAGRLLDLAEKHLKPYPELYEHLDIRAVRNLIEDWRQRIQAGRIGLLEKSKESIPRLNLEHVSSVRSSDGGVESKRA